MKASYEAEIYFHGQCCANSCQYLKAKWNKDRFFCRLFEQKLKGTKCDEAIRCISCKKLVSNANGVHITEREA